MMSKSTHALETNPQIRTPFGGFKQSGFGREKGLGATEYRLRPHAFAWLLPPFRPD